MVGAVIGVAACGLALSVLLRSDSEQPPMARPVDAEFTTGALTLTAPRGWVRSADGPSVPGMSSRAIRLADKAPSTYLIADDLKPSSSTLLPATLLRRLGEPPGEPQHVKLGGRLDAYYYSALWLADRPNVRLDVYAAPTTEGVATVVCLNHVAYATSALADCSQSATRLRLTRGYPVALSQDSAFWLRTAAEIHTIDEVRERARRQLRHATTPIAQSKGAAELRTAYTSAADVLAPLATHSTTLVALVAQLRLNAETYAQVSDHLRARDGAALARDRGAAVEGEMRLKALLSAQR